MSNYRRLLSAVRPHAPLFAAAIASMVILAGATGMFSWLVGPLFQYVFRGGELSAHRPDRVTTEIDFPTRNRLGRGMNAYRIALELDNRARSVHVQALVESVSVRIRSTRSRTTDAKCYDTQPDRREY